MVKISCYGVWKCLQGLALTKVPKLKFLIIISGAKLRNEAWVDKAFSDIIRCPSLHFLGTFGFSSILWSIYTTVYLTDDFINLV